MARRPTDGIWSPIGHGRPPGLARVTADCSRRSAGRGRRPAAASAPRRCASPSRSSRSSRPSSSVAAGATVRAASPAAAHGRGAVEARAAAPRARSDPSPRRRAAAAPAPGAPLSATGSRARWGRPRRPAAARCRPWRRTPCWRASRRRPPARRCGGGRRSPGHRPAACSSRRRCGGSAGRSGGPASGARWCRPRPPAGRRPAPPPRGRCSGPTPGSVCSPSTFAASRSAASSVRGAAQRQGAAVVAKPAQAASTSASTPRPWLAGVGNRSRKPGKRSATREACVCCSITSLTSTAHGSVVLAPREVPRSRRRTRPGRGAGRRQRCART